MYTLCASSRGVACNASTESFEESWTSHVIKWASGANPYPPVFMQNAMPPKVLTIAGSDSGGAAGLQADLRAFAVLAVYGMSAITAVTAQNSVSVSAVQYQPASLVMAQLDAVFSDYGVDAVKTGFIGRPELLIAISAKLQSYPCQFIVVDPVLVNHRGQPMFSDVVRQLYLSYLLPLANLITPNLAEAALLLQMPVPVRSDLPALTQIARRLCALGAQQVLLKGGGDDTQHVDIFYDGQQAHLLATAHVHTTNTHGAGDTLSAAVTAYLAQGLEMKTAVTYAHQLAAQAVQRAASWQLGKGHGPVWPLS